MALHSQGYCHVASGEGPEGRGQGLPLPEGIENGHMPLGALMHQGLLGNALALLSSKCMEVSTISGVVECAHMDLNALTAQSK